MIASRPSANRLSSGPGKYMGQPITTVDTHTMGEPTRIVTGGMQQIAGNTIIEKRDYIADRLDYIRRALMNEPRGHRDMFGAIWLPPTDPAADLAVIFMDSRHYLDMCGHGLIGVVTAAVETGYLSLTEGTHLLKVETPAGLVTVTAMFTDGSVRAVAFQNVPSFLYQKDVPVQLDDRAPFRVDIAYGGSYFALVDADAIGLVIESDSAGEIIDLGLKIRRHLNECITIDHPPSGRPEKVKLVEFFTAATTTEAPVRNTVVFGTGQLDRSPCGTGTCAKMAVLYARGRLDLRQNFIHESIIGTRFRGRLLAETRIGSLPAVIPEITSRAFITGYHRFQIHPDDPFQHGFQI